MILARTLPAVVIALGGATAAAPHVDGAPGAAAGVLTGAGLAALLCAARVRAVERLRGRRMLHEPRLLRPLDRSSLYLEPEAFAERPEGPPATAPWPAHRPPPAGPALGDRARAGQRGRPGTGSGCRPAPRAPGSAAGAAPGSSGSGGTRMMRVRLRTSISPALGQPPEGDRHRLAHRADHVRQLLMGQA